MVYKIIIEVGSDKANLPLQKGNELDKLKALINSFNYEMVKVSWSEELEVE